MNRISVGLCLVLMTACSQPAPEPTPGAAPAPAPIAEVDVAAILDALAQKNIQRFDPVVGPPRQIACDLGIAGVGGENGRAVVGARLAAKEAGGAERRGRVHFLKIPNRKGPDSKENPNPKISIYR